jgi:hypothetical protein
MKHHSAAQPKIGNLKRDHRKERNWFKGAAGNAVNGELAFAAMSLQKGTEGSPTAILARDLRCLELTSVPTGLLRLADNHNACLKWGFSG